MTTSAAAPSAPPIPYVVASWLGYPIERIVAGLRRGSIAPPLGAPPGWLPPGGEAVDTPENGETIDDARAASLPSWPGGADRSEGAATPAPSEGDLRAAYFDLVRSIDPSASDEAFDGLWQGAGSDDAARAARVGDLLWRTVAGGSAAADGQPGGVEALAAAIAERGTRGTLVSLVEDGSAALAARARSDPAALRALASLDAHAFADVEGGAWVASPSEAEDGAAPLSDAWIDDRAKFLAWREAIAADPAAARGAAATWTFVDRTLGDAATVVVGDDPAANRVVFAREGGDRYVGGASVDRIHGAGGDDVLRGAAGDDLIEGAGGDDILSGGAGRDRLDGGAGADEIAGGSGGDVLDGGAGDDSLDGGRGDDTLRGGRGRDTYEFARGDGVDVVDDADGDGVILLDGERLGGDASDGASYATLEEAGSTTLVIRTGAEGGEIRIRDWREGQFGIRLEDRAQAIDEAEAPVPIDAPPRTKPLVSPGDAGADVDAAFSDAGREPGNESGSAARLAGDDASDTAVAPSRGFDRYGVLGIADWFQAATVRPSTWDDAAPPPVADPVGVTASDLASALAGAADGHDDAESAVLRHGPPLWTTGDDGSSTIVPPEVPGRPHR